MSSVYTMLVWLMGLTIDVYCISYTVGFIISFSGSIIVLFYTAGRRPIATSFARSDSNHFSWTNKMWTSRRLTPHRTTITLKETHLSEKKQFSCVFFLTRNHVHVEHRRCFLRDKSICERTSRERLAGQGSPQNTAVRMR